jgi:hypothetical protein
MAEPEVATRTSVAEAARAFLAAVWDGPAPSEAALSEAVDRLVVAYHASVESEPSDSDEEPPKIDWSQLQGETGKRFPQLGYYAVADPLKVIDEAPTGSDAIDDIADITKEMREVVWRGEHLGVEDANWYFRLMFIHWGMHARHLASYLQARKFA